MTRTRQWYYDGSAIGGATGKTHTLTSGQTNSDLIECRTEVTYGADSVAALAEYLVTGGAGISRLAAATRISTSADTTSYNSTTHGGGTFTAQTGTNRLMVIMVTGYIPATGPTSVSVSFGAQTATLLAEMFTTDSVSGAAGIFYIKDADIPTGAQDITVTYGTNNMRSCVVYVAEYSGVNQTTPFGTPSTGNTQTGTLSAGLTVGTTGSAVLSVSGIRCDPVTQLPVSTNRGTLVLSTETGLSSATDNAAAFVEETDVAAGGITVTHTYQVGEPGFLYVVEMFAA